ncbi:MAG: TolC family protein, partial [Chitinophagales bacterium]|nr:TolC family protein [Chitinophagales bacterium]
YGQINSLYNDTKFNVSQSISFPLVYARQKAVYNEQWKNGLLNVALKENELKKAVTQVYYSLQHLQQKRNLLQQTDSLNARFQKNSEERFAAGESNMLEKASADMQRFQITQQLNLLEQDYEIALLQFKILLNTEDDLLPAQSEGRLPLPQLADSQQVAAHPYIKMQLQQQQISNAAVRLSRSKLAPNLLAGYSNQSIRGLQNINGTDRNFTASNRFSSVQVGLGIPLFFGSQKAQINAASVNRTIAQGQYEVAVKDYNNKYKQAWVAVAKYNQLVQQYEGRTLKDGNQIIEIATQQFKNGSIDYLHWVMLVNQSIAIQSDYADAVNHLNQSIIEINSITNK